MKPNGIYVPNITPFDLSGEIIIDAFEELVEYWIKSGVSGIVANASTGEAQYLSRDERKEIIQSFKNGQYTAIVTSQVLDEGVDIPDASVGIILGGTGSSREYIQRLGRILRKRPGKEANLIEIVSRETLETGISTRRHR